MSVHAQPRATKDLDVWISPDPHNAKAVFDALTEFGAPLTGLSAADFAEPGPFFHMGREPVAVDILTAIPGVDFEPAWERRVEAAIDSDALKANFISRADLIAAKLTAGRPRDLADVDELREAEKTQRKP